MNQNELNPTEPADVVEIADIEMDLDIEVLDTSFAYGEARGAN